MKQFPFALTCLLFVVLVVGCNLNNLGDISEEDQIAIPTFIPPGGSYSNDQSVMINCATSGSTIYYTTDNTTPNETAILILESERINLQDYFHRQIEFISFGCILYHTLDILYGFPYNIYQARWRGTRPLTH